MVQFPTIKNKNDSEIHTKIIQIQEQKKISCRIRNKKAEIVRKLDNDA